MTTTTTATEPLLRVGTFGVHLLRNPAGKFSFFGTVPEELTGKAFTFEADGLNAFRQWFRGLSVEEIRRHGPNLRNDIFALVWEGVTK